MNTTYSAVRLTHIPTGIVVAIQDEKSQIKNLEKAMRVLRNRIFEMEYQKYFDAASKRKLFQFATAPKIRTYNYLKIVTDHRINLTTANLIGL